MIYLIRPDRSKHIIPKFPSGARLNGMTPDDDGNLYLTDSFFGYVWRVSAGGGIPSIWIDLHPPGNMQIPGPNGIKFDKYKRNLYISVSHQGTIYRIPFHDDGTARTVPGKR